MMLWRKIEEGKCAARCDVIVILNPVPRKFNLSKMNKDMKAVRE